MTTNLRSVIVGLSIFIASFPVIAVVSPVLPPRVSCSDASLNGVGLDCPVALNPTIQWLGFQSLSCQLGGRCNTYTASDLRFSWLLVSFNIAILAGAVALATATSFLITTRKKHEH
jgi:hypothetical protein